MADTLLRTQLSYPNILTPRLADWSAIWGGAFVFAAVWTIFEMLALAIFAGSSSARSLPSGTATGMDIWTIILTVIAMYVAGHATSRLAGDLTRHDAVIHGMIMFGLAVVGAFVLQALPGMFLPLGSASGAGTYGTHTLGVGTEWTLFLALFLGWLAAMGGAIGGAKQEVMQRQPVPMRPAA